MKALFALLLVVGFGHSAFADYYTPEEARKIGATCNWTVESTGCDYGDTSNRDGQRWVTDDSCPTTCMHKGRIQPRPCIESGFCLPPSQTPASVLGSDSNCGQWYEDSSNGNKCSDDVHAPIGIKQWSRMYECLILDGTILDQFHACSVGVPADH